MLEDYVVTIRLPIDETPGTPGAILGAGFGFNVEESSGVVWYSDGQDIWLPALQATIYAMFRGQLRFVPGGRLNLGPTSGPTTPPSPDEPTSPLLPAMGDCLVLELWPQDFLKLRELLPDPLLVPKRIVYQNVDRDSAVQAAAALVRTHVDHYKKLFLNEGETEIEAEEVVRRANTWLAREWIAGSTVGVYVNPKNGPVVIGEVATMPRTAPDGLPEYARVDHGTPDTPAAAAGYRRLTLKVIDEKGRMLHPAFLFYLMTRIEDEAVTTNWSPESAFISAQNAAVADLPAVRVAARLEEDETEPLDPNPPPAIPMLCLQIRRSSIPVWINGLFDAFEQPEEGRWRFQSKLPPGEYEDTYDAPPLYVKLATRRRITIPEVPERRIFRDVGHQQWLPFYDPGVPDGGRRRRRFILGVNMETCRQNHYHDLSSSDLFYSYYSGGSEVYDGRLETQYSPTSSGGLRIPWLSQPLNAELLRADLQAIRQMGARAVRVWVFEYLEGIRFGFTTPDDPATGRGSALLRGREQADARAHPHLRSYVFPQNPGITGLDHITAHACTKREFDNIAADWRARGLLNVAPPSNPLFRELLDNAATLQRLAGEAGLRVLWTLMTHYGESSRDVPFERLIYYTQERSGTLPPRVDTGNVPVAQWEAFYNVAPNSGNGCLSIEAWVYQLLFTDDEVQQTFVENAVVPFVRHMETVAAGKPLGYEICNEVDIIWDECPVPWTRYSTGDPVNLAHVYQIRNGGGLLQYGARMRGTRTYSTNWKVSRRDVRAFVARCADSIQRTIPSHRDRLILSGVLGTQDAGDLLPFELLLLQENLPGDPSVIRLDASAFTKYAWPSPTQNHHNVWQVFDGSFGLEDVRTLSARLPAPLHGNRCLLVEAGDGNIPENASLPGQQERACQQILRLAVSQGYAGVFLWHYNNPLRVVPVVTNNPLTKGNGVDTAGPQVDLGDGIQGRQAVRALQQMARRYDRLLLPPP